eukprot:TRINITY_DN1162_c0_g1_i9.p1 TRINITY_DN1162_c0_g1~~TRINITY_DN1162_c0_g1_i9.p1  ORF type:complete len:753 (-),score=224.49 TRINITY_DN1162_c0_g1_i9:40-2139(-)
MERLLEENEQLKGKLQLVASEHETVTSERERALVQCEQEKDAVVACCAKLESELRAKNEEIKHLRGATSAKDHQIAALRKTNAATVKDQTALHTEKQNLIDIIGRRDAEVFSLKQELDRCDGMLRENVATRTDLVKASSAAETERVSAVAKCKKAEQELAKLHSAMEWMQQQLHDSAAALQEKTEHLSSLQARVDAMTEEASSHRARADAADARAADAEDREARECMRAKSSAASHAAELGQVKAEVNAQTKAADLLREQIAQLNEQLARAQREAEAARSVIGDETAAGQGMEAVLSAENDALKAHVADLTQELQHGDELSLLQVKYFEATKLAEEELRKRRDVEECLLTLQQELSQMAQEPPALTQTVVTSQGQCTDCERMKAELAQLTQQNADLSTQVQRLLLECVGEKFPEGSEIAFASIQELQQKNLTLLATVRNQTEACEQLERERQQMQAEQEDVAKNLAELSAQRQEEQSQMATAVAQRDAIRVAYEEALSQLNMLKKQIQQTATVSICAGCEQLRAECDVARQHYAEVEKSLREAEYAARAELSEVRVRLATEHVQVELFTDRAKRAAAERDSITKEVESLREQLSRISATATAGTTNQQYIKEEAEQLRQQVDTLQVQLQEAHEFEELHKEAEEEAARETSRLRASVDQLTTLLAEAQAKLAETAHNVQQRLQEQTEKAAANAYENAVLF